MIPLSSWQQIVHQGQPLLGSCQTSSGWQLCQYQAPSYQEGPAASLAAYFGAFTASISDSASVSFISSFHNAYPIPQTGVSVNAPSGAIPLIIQGGNQLILGTSASSAQAAFSALALYGSQNNASGIAFTSSFDPAAIQVVGNQVYVGALSITSVTPYTLSGCNTTTFCLNKPVMASSANCPVPNGSPIATHGLVLSLDSASPGSQLTQTTLCAGTGFGLYSPNDGSANTINSIMKYTNTQTSPTPASQGTTTWPAVLFDPTSNGIAPVTISSSGGAYAFELSSFVTIKIAGGGFGLGPQPNQSIQGVSIMTPNYSLAQGASLATDQYGNEFLVVPTPFWQDISSQSNGSTPIQLNTSFSGVSNYPLWFCSGPIYGSSGIYLFGGISKNQLTQCQGSF